MLTIQTDEFFDRPIFGIKKDFSFRKMLHEIVSGEFGRAKGIKYNNYIGAREFLNSLDFSKIPFSEEEYNKIIKKALKILYDME